MNNTLLAFRTIVGRAGRALIALLIMATLASVSAPARAAGTAAPPNPGQGVRETTHAETGYLTFLGASPQNPVAVPGASGPGILPADRAKAIMRAYGPQFGVSNPDADLSLTRTTSANGRANLRFQQTYKNVPVMGGDFALQMTDDGGLIALSGEASPGLTLSATPTITSDQASVAALTVTAQTYNVGADQLVASAPALWIFDERLLTPSDRPAELVWRLTVTGKNFEPIVEEVLVNASTGEIVLHFSKIDSYASRVNAAPSGAPASAARPPESREEALGAPILRVFTANNTTTLPGTLLCNQGQITSINDCTDGSDPDADTAGYYARQTYDFFASRFNRDSIDNAGMTLKSVVHYGNNYGNAFWNGTYMVYGDFYGFANADDVIAHELTHGVTEHESNLIYAYESGAINESYSDVFGEFVDQTDGAGDDSSGVKWLMGEDVTGLGALRDMQDPTTFGHPDRMGSANYWKPYSDPSTCGNDCGGVHTNSGVNNKAAYLMTDGDTFNGYTVTGLGITKAAAIYYEAQAHLLTSGSDYGALSNALYQACLNKVGDSEGIVIGDCQEVSDATAATEMTPPANDAFANATVISSMPYSTTQSTRAASTASNDPLMACYGQRHYHSVWYRWVAPSNGTLSIDTIGSSYDTVLAVWKGNLGALTSVACDDDSGGSTTSSLPSVTVTAGTSYSIEIAGWHGNNWGTLNLNASFVAAPPPVLLVNGDMEIDANIDLIPDNWKKSSAINTATDKQDCATFHPGVGSCSVAMKGNGNTKKLTQSKTITLLKNTPFTFGVWVKTDNVPGSGPFAQVKLVYTDGTTKVVKLTIPAGTAEWLQYTASFSAAKKVKSLTVTLLYNKSSGFIWFDDVSLTTP